MTFTTKIIILGVTILSFCAGGYFLCKEVYQMGYEARKSEERPYEISEFEKTQIIQQARLNWYPKSVIDSLLKLPTKWITKIDRRDSLIIRDSINVKDSIVFYPVYQVDTSITSSGKDLAGNEVILTSYINQQFFPQQETFGLEFQIKSIKFNLVPVENNLQSEYQSYSFGIFGGVKNKFNQDVYGFIGLEYLPLDYKHLQMFIGGMGNYNMNEKLWDGEINSGVKVKF